MIYKLGLMGATGRMGQQVCNLLADAEPIQGDIFELADPVSENKKLTSIDGVEVRSLDEHPREPVHAWIDFSQPEGTLALLEKIETPVVVATTGFSEKQFEKLQSFASKLPILYASNTSLGITLMDNLIRSLPQAKELPFTAVLHEEHHRHKKDSPSGTAKTLLESLAQAGFSNPQILVTRAGGIKGTHSIKFISDEESLEIKHEAFDRKVFARGALLATRYLLSNEKGPGFYTMADVFKGEV